MVERDLLPDREPQAIRQHEEKRICRRVAGADEIRSHGARVVELREELVGIAHPVPGDGLRSGPRHDCLVVQAHAPEEDGLAVEQHSGRLRIHAHPTQSEGGPQLVVQAVAGGGDHVQDVQGGERGTPALGPAEEEGHVSHSRVTGAGLHDRKIRGGERCRATGQKEANVRVRHVLGVHLCRKDLHVHLHHAGRDARRGRGAG